MSEGPRVAVVILAVQDLERSARFYQAAFGWPRRVDVPVYVEFATPGGLRLGVYERHAFARNTRALPATVDAGAVGPAEVYLHTDDLEAVVERVGRAGGRLVDGLSARAWGDEAAYFTDPDGHVIAVARPLARP